MIGNHDCHMHFDGRKRPKKKKHCMSNKRQFLLAYHHERGKTKKCMSHEKKKNEKNACHMKLPPTKILQRKNFKSQVST